MTKLEEVFQVFNSRFGCSRALDEIAAIGAMMERERIKGIAEEGLKRIPAAARVLYRKDIQKVRDLLDGKEVKL